MPHVCVSESGWHCMNYREYWFFVSSEAIWQWFSRVMMRRFGNDCHEWWSHEWKSLPNRLTSDIKKIGIHGNPYITLSLHAILCPDQAHRPLITIIARSFRSFSSRVVFSDLALGSHHSSICDVTRARGIGIVASYSSIGLARANWHKVDFH